jgi:hypothetical protein
VDGRTKHARTLGALVCLLLLAGLSAASARQASIDRRADTPVAGPNAARFLELTGDGPGAAAEVDVDGDGDPEVAAGSTWRRGRG